MKKERENSNNKATDELIKVKTRAYWDRRIVFACEFFLLVISILLYVIGVDRKNDFFIGFGSNCFTAFLVSILSTIISWKTETDVQKSVRTVEEETSQRITLIQKSTDMVLEQLKTEISSLHMEIASLRAGLREDLNDLDDRIVAFSGLLNMFNGRACTFCKNYIKDIRFSRDECKLDIFFGKAKKAVSILATNLDSFTPYCSQLFSLSKKGVNVRIATLHPDFARSFNITRITGETSPEERWESMKHSLEVFAAQGNTKNFTLRTISGIAPTLILIIVDDECYVAYLINKKKSRDTIHFLFCEENETNNRTPIFYFKKHFEAIWADAGTVACELSEISSLHYTD